MRCGEGPPGIRGKGSFQVKTNYRLDKGQIEAVDDAMADVLRKKTPAERIEIGFRLWTFSREMLIAGLKRKYPEWDMGRIEREAARRLSHGAV